MKNCFKAVCAALLLLTGAFSAFAQQQISGTVVEVNEEIVNSPLIIASFPLLCKGPLRVHLRGGCAPSALPMRGGAAPRPLHSSPWGGRSAPPPRVTFPPRGKSPKARQGLRPLESPRVPAKLWEPDAVRFEGWSASPIELEAITIPYRPFRARCAALRLAPGYLLPQK